ncbi:MAG: tetratricopeptide repeat protein [Bacteroidota bacterium]
MKHLLPHFHLACFVCFPFLLLAQPNPQIELPLTDENRILFEAAKTIHFQDPDSAIILLERCYNNLITKGDTLNAIASLAQQAQTYGHQAHYKDSYDKLWKGLMLADRAKLHKAKAYLYLRIGRHYSYYKRKNKALEYFDLSRQIIKELILEEKVDAAALGDVYYISSSTYRELGEPSWARIYLDSCFTYHSPYKSEISIAYLQFERAFLLQADNLLDSAIATYQKVLPWMEKYDPGYQTLVYTYIGDVYQKKEDFNTSERYYKKALEISGIYKSHIDFTPLVHTKLSNLYFKKGDLAAAYKRLTMVKELDGKFFDSRSENNRPLLEIQDAFRLEKASNMERLKEQKLAQLENEEKVLFLQRTILIVCLIFLTVIGVIFFNHVSAKHKTEKQLIHRKQELEIQKANEIVELKNRELSASTLKLIQKDEFISSLKAKVTENGDKMSIQEIKRALNTISVGNEQNWKEFEARFVDVNKDFYARLKAKFPHLTQGDLKLCALIKLNFSSKDMAKLMGISVESVHTTRYRLRKKLGLLRKENLTEFIATI